MSANASVSVADATSAINYVSQYGCCSAYSALSQAAYF